MRNRIFGLETEYAIKHYPDEGTDLKRKLLAEADLFELLNRALRRQDIPRLAENKHSSDGYRSSLYGYGDRAQSDRNLANRDGMFLGNGARFYMDSGGHPEFASPECLSPRDVVIFDKCGERLLEGLARIAEEEMRREGFTGHIFVCKNNVDIRGNTYGCHENYLIERKRRTADESDFFKGIIKHLLPFLVTRQVLCGAGKVLSNGKLKYQIAQRSDFIDEEVSSSTTSKRGIINLKDEPLSVREKYRRLHLILGDANMSEYSSHLKIAVTGVVLELIENDLLEFDLSLSEPVQAIKDISADLGLKARVRLRNGADLTAVEIQREYLKAARRYLSTLAKANQELGAAVLEWERVLDGLEQDQRWVYRNIDYKIKERLLYRYLEKQGSSFDRLRHWDFFVNKMKDLRLERELLEVQASDPGVDLAEYLRTKLSQADAIQLRRNLKYLDIDLGEYHRVHRVYHGLIERDLRYHDVSREQGLYYLMRRGGFVDHWGGDDFERRTEEALRKPPSNTRARVRGMFIKWMNEHNFDGGARWDSIYIYGKQLKKIDLPSPFKSSYRKVTELMRTYKG
jgi:hypothetical protein